MSKAELLANLYSANGPIGGGTAGGLLYLDGSKTLTTGSALQFDGTNLGLGGNLTLVGLGNRITGDFSNATIANRVAFQSTTTNGATDIPVIPNGTSTNARHFYYSTNDITNASLLTAGVVGPEATFRASAVGTGTSPPMTFYTGGSERVRIDTSGNVGIGTSLPAAKFAVSTGDNRKQFVIDTTSDPVVKIGLPDWYNVGALAFINGSGGERMRIDSSGNVGIGITYGTGRLNTTIGNAGSSGAYATNPGTIVINEAGASSLAANGGLEFKTSVFGAGYGAKIQALDNGTLVIGNRDNSATWSERMRIDSSGNVGIGTSTPDVRLNVAQVSSAPSSAWAGGTDFIKLTALTGSAYAEPTIAFQEAGSNIGAKIGGKNTGNGAMNIIFANRDGSSVTSAITERLRIDTSGNLSSASDQYRTRYYQSGSFIPGSTNWMRLCTLLATNQGQHVEFMFAIPGQHLLMKVKFSKTTSGGFGGGGVLEVEQLGSYVYNNYYPFDWRLVDGGTNGPSHIDIRFPYNAGESIGYRINVLHSWSAQTDVHATFPLTNLGSGTTGSRYVNMGDSNIGWTKQWFKMTGTRYSFYDSLLFLASGATPPTA